MNDNRAMLLYYPHRNIHSQIFPAFGSQAGQSHIASYDQVNLECENQSLDRRKHRRLD